MLISVVVPVHGVERYLPACVKSILAQAQKDLEVILVDDGSPDSCPAICDGLASADSRVRVIHKPNGGLASARKEGLRSARGKYVGYVDGDDWIEPEMYRHMAMVAEQANADIVACGFKKDIEGNCTRHRNCIPCGIYRGGEIAAHIVPRMMFSPGDDVPGIYTYVWNKLFRRELLMGCQLAVPDDISVGEDAACVFPAILDAGCIAITDATHYHYRQRSNSMLKVNADYRDGQVKLGRLYRYLQSSLKGRGKRKMEGMDDGLERFILYMFAAMTGGAAIDGDGNLDLYLYGEPGAGISARANRSKPQPACPEGPAAIAPVLARIGTSRPQQEPCRIAVYGAGTLGQHLISTLARHGGCEIVKWIDPDYQEYRSHGLLVDSEESVMEAGFEELLVAMASRKEALRVEMRLRMLGVPEEKIILPRLHEINAREMARRIFS